MKYPVVIPYVRTQDGGQELKYTLRSLKNLTEWNGEVFIIGDREDWFRNITHIPNKTRSYSPYEDVENKVLLALRDRRIPDDFIFTNDDIYITRKTTIKNWHRGELPKEGKGYHMKAKIATRSFLISKGIENPLDFSVHAPMILNKQKRMEVHKIVKRSLRGTALLARTIYGNMFIDPKDMVKTKDKKTKTSKLMSGAVISTQYFTDELSDKFPEESKFEPNYITPVPKIIHQVWIGPLPPPQKWMVTWKAKNPDWKYMFWGNRELKNHKWKNQHLIDEYLRRYNDEVKNKFKGIDKFVSARGAVFKGEKATLFAWHVIADIIRYEILHEYGGYMPGADTQCLKSINDKWDRDFDCYTVRTGNLYEQKYHMILQALSGSEPNPQQKLMLERYHPLNSSPILASKKGSKFLAQIIDELHKLKPEELGEAVDTTGNVFMGKMIEKYNPPGLYNVDYVVKKDRVKMDRHSIHYAGTTLNSYRKGR